MPKALTRLVTVALLMLIGGFILFMLNQIAALAQLCATYFPQSYDYVLFGISGIFLVCCLSPLAVFIFRPGPLTMPEDPTPAEQRIFIRKLRKRLRKNKYIRRSKMSLSSNEDLDMALNMLDEVSTEKMKSVASRIFLSTAISQNGQLDSFIVLGSLTKLVWDVSRVYNQRPSFRDMVSVYANVAGTAFFAGAVEELDIQSQIEAIMSPVLAGSALGMIPGAGGLTSIVTASILDGSTNAFLALRVGIITRGHFNFHADKKSAGYRRAVLKEAAGMLLSIAVGSTKMITTAYIKTITRSAGQTAANAAKKVVDSKDKAFEATGRAARFSAKQVGKMARFATFKDTAEASPHKQETIKEKTKKKLHKAKKIFRNYTMKQPPDKS
ncbi:DUF697 domain-containing protein [Maridesulfovibrio hydrothermalis]|uniref:Uncharacterized protein n=1 Tax=Maridesulfovibrio hydrothermalis AM13 = DSM 14728 TaxID=1121451 RepID=L0RDE7_9BACT|nr:DUF697 domain-containing protein [Maridesulfovibrio hydrothermalis]CCO23581.1 conserved exported protein of unknown function [Maridesulfovibrio hydrothermalis AM13 = DSM 14728]